jgi:hypothetical protein
VDRYNTKRAGDSIERTGVDPVDPLLVFVKLLVGDADQLRKPLLSDSPRYPSFEDARAHVAVEGLHTAENGLCTRHRGDIDSVASKETLE